MYRSQNKFFYTRQVGVEDLLLMWEWKVEAVLGYYSIGEKRISL